MTNRPIYLDNHATTRVDPRVVEAMLPFFTETYGNAASTSHSFGWEAKEAVDQARATIATAIGATARNRLHQRRDGEQQSGDSGSRRAQRRRGNHLVTVQTEHRAVLDPMDRLGRRGFEVTHLAVEQAGSDRAGWLDPETVGAALRDDTLLVSVMLANNEIGGPCRATGAGTQCCHTNNQGPETVHRFVPLVVRGNCP